MDISKILIGANLTNANLCGADLTNARLTNANLKGADLYGADLTNANLKDVDLRWIICGNNKEIKTLQLSNYLIVMTSEEIAIGCQQHRIEKWLDFKDDEIDKMSRKALEFFKKFKSIIEQIHQLSF